MSVTYMPGVNAEGEKLSIEQTQELIAWALMAILDKMPQPNVQDQLPVVFPTTQTVNIGNAVTIQTYSASASMIPYNLSAGAYHIYQGIQVS